MNRLTIPYLFFETGELQGLQAQLIPSLKISELPGDIARCINLMC
jgi:hypothetical protein